ADVEKEFIFRYLSKFSTDSRRNILWKTAERYFNQIIELNKLLNNVCIFWVYSNKDYVLSS
ncbi:MAG: hypothetical protein H6Q94_1097, partial [Nitrospirae bacterium]|nr:hypothetical protein [Nitrospirota bacterium]